EGTSFLKFVLGKPFNIWMGIIGGHAMVVSPNGVAALILERGRPFKKVARSRKSVQVGRVVVFPLLLVFFLGCVLLRVFYQGHPLQIAPPEPRPGSGIKANDFIFPVFMVTEVPHLLKGFLIVAILSAAMSSVSSALTSLASVSTMDFVKHALPQRSE